MSMKCHLRNSATGNHQPEVVDFLFKVVATVATDSTTHLATSIVPLGGNAPAAYALVTAGITQAQVNALLPASTASDVLATAFGSTRLGTDMVGFIMNFEGQVRELVAVECIVSASTVADSVATWAVCYPTGTALTDAAAVAATFEKSADGNVYGSITKSGLDAAVAGLIHIRVLCVLK